MEDRPIRRHTWKWVLGCGLAIAALAWYLHAQLAERGFDWGMIGSSISHLHWEWLLLSFIPIFGTYYGRALRWAVFLRPLKQHPSVANLFSATIIGYTAIALFGRPGEFVRPYLIAVKERVPVSSQLAAWVLERIFDLLMALLVFAFALSRVDRSAVQLGPNLTWVLEVGGRIVTVACLLLLVLLLSFRHFAQPIKRRLTAALSFLPDAQHRKAESLMEAFVQGVESTRSDGALLLVFLYSVIEWILIAACYWCLARSFQGIIVFSLVDVLIFMGFVSFGAIVQIPGIGGGMQVVAVVVLTELFDLRLEVATAFAVIVWLITFVVVVPFGLILALKEGLDWQSLRRLGRESPK
jgi:glycosyltransferase 2 family protein